MRALLLTTLLLSISNSPKSEAFELYTKTAAANAPANWTYIYNEDSHWIVEEIALDASGWPVLKSRHIYEHEKLARVAMIAKTATDIRLMGIPEDGNELSDPAGDTLWTVTNQWSWDWEVKYSDWVKTELNTGYWKQHGLATDCADVAYSARWIFARNNGLPMANRLGNGQWFTYKSVKPEWKRLPHAAEWYNDKKFLAGLNFFLDFVFTHSLWNDSYPIAINADSLRPGAHHLALHDRSGHTQLVYHVGTQPDEIPVTTLNSTIPRDVRELWEYKFYNSVAREDSDAFLRMRWPKWNGQKPGLADATAMPYYSKEQFDPNFVRSPRTAFWEEVFFRLNPNVDMLKVAARGLNQVTDLMRARLQIVEDGYQACSGNPCPEGSALWETWSTPTRDSRIKAAIDLYYMVVNRLQDRSSLEPILNTEILTQEGYTFTLQQLMAAWRLEFLSSNPNEEPVVRWGVHPRGVALGIQQRTDRALKDRAAKIARGGTCKSLACEFGSEKYVRESSFDIDKTVWLAAVQPAYYCQYFSETLCADLNARLDQFTVTSDGRTLGVREWLKEASLFNSDPRNAVSRRYFSYSKDFPHFMMNLSGARKIDEYRGEAIMVYRWDYGPGNYSGTQLYVLNGLNYEEWNAPAGEILKGLDTVQGWIWSMQGGNLFARKLDSVQTPAYPVTGTVRYFSARNGRALVVDDSGSKILTIGEAGITAVALDPELTLAENDVHEGYAVYQRASTGTFAVVDLYQGEVLQVPETSQVNSLVRMSGGRHLFRFPRPDGEGFSCAVISKDAPILLNVDGDCIVADPSGYAMVSANGSLIKRSFNDWQFAGDTNLGEFQGAQSNRLYKVERGGQEISYCATSHGPVALPDLGAGATYYECNNRFADAFQEGKPWRVVDIASGDVVFEVPGYAIFASSHLDEHFILTVSDSGAREGALMDLDHLEKFSMLSDSNVYPFENFRTNRANGLIVYKNGNALYLKSAL